MDVRFDPARPHGSVSGMRGVAFEQDGKLFGSDGNLAIEVTETPAVVIDTPSEAEIDNMNREEMAILATRLEMTLDKRMTDLKWRRAIKERLGISV